MKKTAYSDSFKVFLGLVGLLLMANLLLVNDYAAIWTGTETDLLLSVQEGRVDNFVAWITAAIYENKGLSLGWLRLPGVIFLLLTVAGFYYFGKKIFGRDTTVLTLLVAGSSFVLLNVCKFISADVYLLFAQIMYFIFLILFIKQPLSKWRWANYVFLVVGMLFQPLAMGLWVLVTGLVLWGAHPKKEQLRSILVPGGFGLMALAVGMNFMFGNWNFEEFVFSFGQLSPLKTLGYLSLGMLPWLGFLPAALWDLWKKLKSGEEMAIIITAWLLGAMISLSLSFGLVLAFMIAKQVWVALKPGYPYLRLVKAFCLLNLLATFFLVLVMLLGGLNWFGGGGYRSLLSLGFVYWIFSFLALMGLFMKDRRVVIGGYVFSGVMATLTFWGNIYPVFDNPRQLTKLVVEKAAKQKISSIETLVVSDADWAREPGFSVYANKHFSEWEVISDSVAFEEKIRNGHHQIVLIDNKMYPNLDSSVIQKAGMVEHVAGWGRRGTVVYVGGNE